MSENKKSSRCKKCGGQNSGGALFCHACGSKIEPAATKAAAPVEAENEYEAAPRWYRRLHRPAVFSALSALLSLLLIFFAFTPFISVGTKRGEEVFYTSFTPIEVVRYAVEWYEEYDEAALHRTSEYKAYNRLLGKVSAIGPSAKLTDSRKEMLADFTKSAIEVEMLATGTTLKGNHIAAALFTVLYLGVAAFALLFSLFTMVKCAFGAKSVHKSTHRAAYMLGALASFFPIYSVVLAQACRFSQGFGVAGYGNGGVLPARGLIWSAVLLLSVPVYLFVRYRARVTRFLHLVGTHGDRMRLIAFVLLVAAVLAVLLLPAASVSFTAPASGKTAAKEVVDYISPLELYEFSSEDRNYFISENVYVEGYITDLAKEVTESERADGEGVLAFHGVIGIANGMTILYVVIVSLVSAFSVFAILTLRKLAGALALGRSAEKRKRCTVPMLLFGGAYLATSFFIMVVGHFSLPAALSPYIDFGIGIGPIVALFLAVAAIVALRLPPRRRRVCQFDNPDTSSAPYVLNN